MKLVLDEFLRECVDQDPDNDGLGPNELYGLYVSWCALNATAPVADRTFRVALGAAGISPACRAGPCPGLAMTGPAARDYIVHSELPLLVLEPGTGPQNAATPGVSSTPVTHQAVRTQTSAGVTAA
ncbi:hypothetical protein RCH07_003163 [Arthrobacter sp. CG_A4]|nr:hypothetical protein [Arthrobacter sp. CG_A4]